MRLIKFAILSSIITIIACFIQRNTLPSQMDFSSKLQLEPIQYRSYAEPFNVAMSGINYKVEPLYDYTLYGMVVSLKQHNGDSGLHRAWGDHLNIADLCVVWSDTAFSPLLHKIEFWNGQFTCFTRTSNMNAWALFKGHQLSNNHLITESSYLRNKIKDIQIGDQIQIKGWLANYQNDRGNKRGTSITRTDTGNGACETIYVNEIKILKPYHSPWRIGLYAAITALILSIIAFFKAPLARHI
ncbi:hypothetical protein MHM98_06520 [Psychrobium sp. MM17-31]|uniref:hypothetical protein n=1 Tax=Psychrobium sp. MM17-31 TaxID=2917758 RepID=UPI001EF64C6D|nr:hypothetical protein [Psychrobium sp. MM17-31]MCG7531001.1 hypothetical protein [Psychrobium sp. MM17-31]